MSRIKGLAKNRVCPSRRNRVAFGRSSRCGVLCRADPGKHLVMVADQQSIATVPWPLPRGCVIGRSWFCSLFCATFKLLVSSRTATTGAQEADRLSSCVRRLLVSGIRR